jgi:hypothetical protein
MKMRSFLLMAACVVLCGQAQPDVLTFANGEKLIGHLVRSNGANVTFKSDSLGEVNVPWSKIKELTASEKFAVVDKGVKLNRRSDTSKVAQGTVTMADQVITVTPATGEAQKIPVANAAHLIDQPTFEKDVLHNPGLTEAWNGAMTLGVTIVEATQQSRTFSGGIHLQRAIPTENWLDARNRTSLNFNAAEGTLTQPNTPTIRTAIYHGDIERDAYFTDSHLFAFGQAAWDHNYSQGLDLQQNYGGGIGMTVIKHSNTTLDFKGSVSYTRQSFQASSTSQTSSTSQDLIGSVFAETYMHKTARGIQFQQSLSATPAWNNTHAYAAAASGTLTIPVYKRFAFTTSLIDTYLNNPPLGFKKNSFQFTTGLTYSLK